MEQIGRYRIVEEVGRGAMGVVYAALDPLIGRKVAIKTIHLSAKEYGRNREELRGRLFREAQSTGILSHPGIITIHDIGEEGEEAYIVMEFVDGKTLEDVFCSGVPQHSDLLFSILRKAAEALDYAHSKGIIHRDIKPSNLMLCADGTLKVADFGIAKISAASQLTQTGFAVGTPSYMSPEQAQGHAVGAASDQFSLAVVAYRMLTGKLPFEGPTMTAVLAKLLMAEPEYENAGLHPKIQAVFKRALSKDPQERFSCCMEFIIALQSAHAYYKEELLAATVVIRRPAAPKAAAGAAPPSPVKVSYSSAAEPQAVPLAPPATPVEAEPCITEPSGTGGLAGQPPAVGQPAAPMEVPKPSEAVVEKPATIPSTAEFPRRHKGRAIPKVAWFSALGVVCLAVIVFFVIRGSRRTESPPTPAPGPAQAASKPSTDAAPAIPKEVELAKSTTSTPARTGKGSDRGIPRKGVLTWSGKLGKNSILVIDGASASIGTLVGKLPGKPVRIEVEPEGVQIRQGPGSENSWSQIVLSSGTEKRTSITIRWEITK